MKWAVIISIPILLSFYTKSQVEFAMSDNAVFSIYEGYLYDDGGANGNVSNYEYTSSVKSSNGYFKLFFEYVQIPNGAKISIYEGLDTSNMIGVYDGQYKPSVYYGKAFTLKYSPGFQNGSFDGWKIKLEHINVQHVLGKASMPESDCINAIPICSNSTINTSQNQYDDTGQVNDDSGSCYSGTGQGGSVWYTFTPQTNGLLDFAINPTGSTDYDFVLWDITNGCDNKVELSCNYAAPTGATGLSTAGTSNSEGSSGSKWCQRYNVVTTKVYALCINYYSGNNDGFTLTFQNDPSSVAVIDNTPPEITNAYTDNCASATTFIVNFSEYMDCSTLDNSDFTIPGYSVVISNDFCSGGKTLQVELTVSPAMPPGNYTLSAQNCTDFCGNPLNDTYNINTTAVPTANAGPDQIACSSPGFFGSTNYGTVSLTGSGGTSYVWSTGQTNSSISVSPHVTTVYTLTAIQGSCSATDQVTVTVAASPTPNLGPDQTICAGFPVTLGTTAAGTNYQWQSTTSTNFFGQPNNWSTIGGANSSSYTATPGSTTYYQVTVTNAQGCTGSDVIKITTGSGAFSITSPPFICEGESTTLTLPSSMTNYTWDIGGSSVGTANTPLTVSPTSTTTYNVTSTTAGCTGNASVTIDVHPAMNLNLTASPTTACTGIPVNLNSNAPSNSFTSDVQDFESSNGFTLVNGTYNKWYSGNAAFANGTNGLYIGTASTNNNYVVTGGFLGNYAATNHAYRNYNVTSYCDANLSFNWKCGGNNNAALTVWIVPTTYTPVAGTAIVASPTEVLVGGPYFGSGSSYTNVSLDLSSYAGQSIRLVFSWKNTGGLLAPAPVPPAASIDDVIYSESMNYNYAWTSSPAGFSASTANAIDNPTAATSYDLLVTRCDGCSVQQTINIDDCVVLPVILSSFQGSNHFDYNWLHWTSNIEVNNDFYRLERSVDLVNWELIGVVDGAGNSSSPNNYEYKDQTFRKGATSYYRLVQVDFNGATEIFDDLVALKDQSTIGRNIIGRTNILGQEIGDSYRGIVIITYDNGEIEKSFSF